MPRAEGKFRLHEDDAALALHALGWILSDEPRAERLLGMTGLDPDALRASLGERATLAAILSFLTAYEADLVACAEALDVKPEAIAAAAARLDGQQRMDA
ncbi:hypothetical protein ATE67_18160 [Sphingopyxis sp. H050]|nr:hypothetical protein ATE67_18160 [Sphingopyxis sp. H050]